MDEDILKAYYLIALKTAQKAISSGALTEFDGVNIISSDVGDAIARVEEWILEVPDWVWFWFAFSEDGDEQYLFLKTDEQRIKFAQLLKKIYNEH